MRFTGVAVLLAGLAVTVQAHMKLNYPPPFNASNNPHTEGPGDRFLQFPHNCCGQETPFPCRGYLPLLGTPAGHSVASWQAGTVQNFNVTGTGNHYGGSCQVGFSIDKGETFRVATSYEGNCPHRKNGKGPEGQNFDFTVPKDLPEGQVVFAWTWVNREQEFFMNCAAVDIVAADGRQEEVTEEDAAVPGSFVLPTASVMESTTSAVPSAPTPSQSDTFEAYGCTCSCSVSEDDIKNSGKRIRIDDCTCTCPRSYLPAIHQHNSRHGHSRYGVKARDENHQATQKRQSADIPFNERPTMLFPNLGNGCLSPLTTAELKYPHPGPDVVPGDDEYPLELPKPADKCGY